MKNEQKNVDKTALKIYHFGMNKRGMTLVEILVSMILLAISALAVTATIALVNSEQMRSAGGSSLDLQALNYAKQTLESLKNAVSTAAGRAAPLSAGLHDDDTTALPASDLLDHGGTRTYTVTDVDANADGVLDYKRVTVSVLWPD